MKKKRMKHRQVHREKHLRHRQKIVAMILGIILILVLVSFAWYTLLQRRMTRSQNRDVMAPYYLYLVDETGTDSLELTVGNLHPGETKQIVIGVTNQKPNDVGGTSYTIAKDSGFHYELELAHTNNLPINYKLYALEETDSSENVSSNETVVVSGVDSGKTKTFVKSLLSTNTQLSSEMTTKNNQEMYGESATGVNTVNWATYDIYDKRGEADFQLNTKLENGKVSYDLNYYLIELSWQDGIQFDNYLKETDLMYVIVNAMQPEPKELTPSTD